MGRKFQEAQWREESIDDKKFGCHRGHQVAPSRGGGGTSHDPEGVLFKIYIQGRTDSGFPRHPRRPGLRLIFIPMGCLDTLISTDN